MKKYIIAFLLLFISGCNLTTDVNGNLAITWPTNTNTASEQSPLVFYGIIDSANYYFDNSIYQCFGGYIYNRQDTSMTLIGQDQVPAVCEEVIYTDIDFSQTTIPLYGQ